MACRCNDRQFGHRYPEAGGHAEGNEAAPVFGGRFLSRFFTMPHRQRGQGVKPAGTADNRHWNTDPNQWGAHTTVPFNRLLMSPATARLQLVRAPVNDNDLSPQYPGERPDTRVHLTDHPALHGPQWRYTKVTAADVIDNEKRRLAHRARRS
jgi:hypothetical protein